MTSINVLSASAPAGHRARALILALAVNAGFLALPSQAASDLSRLQTLLDATPDGGWVKASTGSFSSAWPTGSTSVGTLYPIQNSPGAIVSAWSSFAWDSNSGQMLLWGGGHANYAGNEMYAWKAGSGAWERQSLPSMTVPSTVGPNTGVFLVSDNSAPVSSHTYDGSVFLPVNNMFINFLGPSYNSGDRGKVLVNGVLQNAGPWMFDPTKANGNLVGGTDGSGYDPTSLGGNMWINRYGQWTGTEGPYSPYVATAYRNEGGKDVVYLTMDRGASHYVDLVRYTVGDVRNGGLDKWETIGMTDDTKADSTVVRGGTATLDDKNNLLVRAAWLDAQADLAVWDLDLANAQQPSLNRERAIQLVGPNGEAFMMNEDMAIEYDSAHDQIVIWDGSQQGMVWVTRARYDANGQLLSTWEVQQLTSATTAQPRGNYAAGVYGKWKYIDELGAFMALDEFNRTTQDAEVWLYKPGLFSVQAVPEAQTWAMLLLGLSVTGWAARRRQRA